MAHTVDAVALVLAVDALCDPEWSMHAKPCALQQQRAITVDTRQINRVHCCSEACYDRAGSRRASTTHVAFNAQGLRTNMGCSSCVLLYLRYDSPVELCTSFALTVSLLPAMLSSLSERRTHAIQRWRLLCLSKMGVVVSFATETVVIHLDSVRQ